MALFYGSMTADSRSTVFENMKLSLQNMKNMEVGKRQFLQDNPSVECVKLKSGKISFRTRYTILGKRKYASICRFDPQNTDATITALRHKINEVRNKIDLGEDPQAEKLKRAAEVEIDRVRVENQRTMGEVADEWLECAVMKGEGRKPPRQNKPQKDTRLESAVVSDMPDRMREIPIEEFTRSDLLDIVLPVYKEHPNMGNKIKGCYVRIFKFACKQRDYISPSHMAGVTADLPTYKSTPRTTTSKGRPATLWQPKQRGLLKAWLDEFDRSDLSISRKGALYFVLLGQRRTETSKIHMDNIDVSETGEREWWNLLDTETKNNEPHRVFIPPSFRKYLVHEKGWAFPSSQRGIKTNPRTIYGDFKAIAERVGLGDFTLHDLRRTFSTFVSLNFSEELMHRLTNHKPDGLTKTYSVADLYRYDDKKIEIFTAWEKELASIRRGQGQNVVSFVSGSSNQKFLSQASR